MTSRRTIKFGWNADGSPNEEQQKVINIIAESWICSESATGVARELNELGIPTMRGGKWLDTTVRKIITDNPDHVEAARKQRTIFNPPDEAAATEKLKEQLASIPNGNVQTVVYRENGKYKERQEWVETDPNEGFPPRKPGPFEEYLRANKPPPPPPPPEWAKIPRATSTADYKPLSYFFSGKTRRVPGPRLPDGSYPRGYWPMPPWWFFEQAAKVARLPCVCAGTIYSGKKPPPPMGPLKRPGREEVKAEVGKGFRRNKAPPSS